MNPPPLLARWDLDKTYLRSDFYSLGELLRSATERADQKRQVPGARSLLGQLSASARIHVVSGSPEQMRRSITQRLRLDGVRVDELTLKPNLENLLHFRFSELKDQLGYKLFSLLDARARELSRGESWPREVLVGDDSEADAFVYSLYADVAHGAISRDELRRILDEGGTRHALSESILSRAAAVNTGTCVAPADFRILIHLDRQTPPSHFANYGARVVPFFNYAQAAYVLVDQGMMSAAAAISVCRGMLDEHRFDVDALVRSYLDLVRRGYASERGILELTTAAAEALPEFAHALSRVLDEQRVRDGARAAPTVRLTSTDYQELARQHRGGKNRAQSPWREPE